MASWLYFLSAGLGVILRAKLAQYMSHLSPIWAKVALVIFKAKNPEPTGSGFGGESDC
jgi:hypothetical protein